jgi:F0F1-type ATP synthase epsilon subunit
MLPESIELIIVTPERQFLSESVVEVVMQAPRVNSAFCPGTRR